MSTEELRLYSQIPTEINLETSDNEATIIVREEDNVVYFTRELFAVGLLSHPVPGPTRMADPNRVRCETVLLGLSLTCSFSELNLYRWLYKHNFYNKKKSFLFTKELPPEWCPSKSMHIYLVPFTYTCTFFFLIQNIRDGGSSAVSTYL